ncbi:MAG: DNA translocase FtsK [Blautia sp.]|nr:DNA translocase FtsK [Blautia sp.]
MPGIIRRFQDNERYLEALKKDLRLLDGEKIQCEMVREDNLDEQQNLKKLSVAVLILAFVAVFLLVLMYFLLEMDTMLYMLLVTFLAVAYAAYALFKHQDLNREIAQSNVNRNKAIDLQNHVKIKYVTIQNAVDYVCNKYEVKSSAELIYNWEQFQEMIREKQRMREEKRAKRIRVLEEAISQEEKQKEIRPSVTEKRPFMEGSKLLPDKPADPIPKKEMPDPPVMMPELSLPEVPAKEEQMQFEIHSEDMAHEEIDDFSEDVEEIYDEMEGIHPIERTSGPSEEPDIRKPARKTKATQQEVQDGIQNIAHEIQADEEKPKKKYVFPPLNLLNKSNGKKKGDSNEYIRQTAQKLQDTLCSFGVNATVTNVSCGPSVTRYELKPEMGVTVSKITRLSDDIKLNLAAEDIRIEAPIPGKTAVGIEVPNKEKSVVLLRDLLQSEEFQNAKSCISFAVGKDIEGKPVIADIAKMPHLLIAGATGSGKSVCINTLIISILYKAKPEDVKLIMIDPKVVELSVYNGIPHLLIPVVTDPKKAAGALNWAVSEMTARYNTFAEYGVRNLSEYTRKIEKMTVPADEQPPEKMPQIVVIVDELADLMMVASGEVEDAIVRLSQLARAAGIHLIIATQRPSVNVITGLIKANMPSRIAFSVSSGVDSRTILDTNGAEKLLGKGDMLFYPQGYPKAARVQGALVSDEEVSAIVGFLANKNPAAEYDAQIEQQVNTGSVSSGGSFAKDERDHYFMEAGKLIIEKDKASIGMLQRIFKIGFNRAARIMDQLNEAGVVGPEEGTKPRKVLMTMEQFEEYLASE